MKKMDGRLVLNDGTEVVGKSFGSDISASGEVVFNTGMSGYPETLTDPSYYGQILVCTYPLIGNYGVPKKELWESQKIQVKALIVQNYIDNYSHFEAQKSLGDWLNEEGIPALSGVDTRALTSKLRHHGVMLGKLVIGNNLQKIQQKFPQRQTGSKNRKADISSKDLSIKIFDPNSENILPYVSPTEVKVYGEGRKNIVLIDCGAKENIIRSLVKRKVKVTRVPFDYDLAKLKGNFDGVLVSNGPGDPKQAVAVIETIQKLLSGNVPTFGICLGSQLLALAAGADTYKLKFGHRGQNQPCQNVNTKKCIVTSQNHGFAVDVKNLPKDWSEWFINLNDGTNEGIRHNSKPFLSVQFHPEATPGPTDAGYLFDEFINLI